MAEVPPYAGLTAVEATRQLARTLAEAGLDSPAADARLLVSYALQMPKQDLILHPGRPLGVEEARELAAFETRRLAREPVSRILSTREFYGRSFTISSATLDPRPDSETLIDAALEWARRQPREPLRILDIGTGSGCLLLSLLAELPKATGMGTDISANALEIASRNGERLGLSQRVSWQVARSLEGLEGTFDVVISNPPYIASAGIAELSCEVRLYDPGEALDGGFDGLQIYREIIAGLRAAVNFGAAFLEVGEGQAEVVQKMIKDALGPRAAMVHTRQDLGGHVRCVAVETHC